MLRLTSCTIVCCFFAISSVHAESRTWKDKTGKHSIEAELVKVTDTQVTLKRADGKTTTLPISKLSKADREFLKQSNAKTKPAISDQKAIKQVASRFILQLGRGSAQDITDLISDSSAENAAEKLISEFPKPDRGTTRAIRKIVVKEDTATAEISYKARTRFTKHSVKLERDADTWKISEVVVNVGKEEEQQLSLASLDSSKNQTTGDKPTVRKQDDLSQEFASNPKSDFQVPKNATPEKVIEFIAMLNTSIPPKSMSRGERYQFDSNRFKAMRTAAEFVLDSDDANETQLDAAAQATLVSMNALVFIDAKAIASSIDRLPNKFKSAKLPKYVPMAKAIDYMYQLRVARSSNDIRSVIGKITRHLENKDYSRFDYELASFTANASRRLEPELASETHRAMAAVLSSSKAHARSADRLLASARRFDLVGNEMALQGISADGASFDLSDLKGKVVLVDFWATWCGPCIREMPNILKNHKKYHDQGFEVVAVSVDRNIGALEKYITANNPPWIVLADRHPKNPASMSDFYGISAIPTTILVGADGKVISLNCRGARLGKELAKIFGEKT